MSGAFKKKRGGAKKQWFHTQWLFGANNLKVQMIGPGMELHESEVADFIQSKAPLERPGYGAGGDLRHWTVLQGPIGGLMVGNTTLITGLALKEQRHVLGRPLPQDGPVWEGYYLIRLKN